MSAGPANVTVNTQTNVTSITAQFSSDGTTAGVLQPFPVLSDANRTPFFTGTNPGSVSVTGGNVTASLAPNQTLGTLTAITNPVNVAVTSSVPAGTNTIGSVNLAPNAVVSYVGQINGALPAGANALGSVTVTSGTLTAALAANQTLGAVTAITNTVNAAVTSALPAGSNTIGSVTLAGSAAGGSASYHLVCAATTNPTSVKASAGTLKGVQVYNNSATIAYLKFYNTSGAPTAGSGTPVKVVMIPASTSGAGAVVPLPPEGIAFGTGIGITVTGGIADNDATAVAASALLVEIDYK